MGNNNKKKINKKGKKRLNAKLECYLARPHALSHEVSERETFCNNFYSTIFLQFFYFYFYFTLFLNWIIITVMCVQFIIVVSLHIYSILKVRLLLLFFWIMKPKINAKEWWDHENQIICVVFTYLILWNKSMSNFLTVFRSLIVQH